jgi:hypothetical protein
VMAQNMLIFNIVAIWDAVIAIRKPH